jgi:hypothetical protein
MRAVLVLAAALAAATAAHADCELTRHDLPADAPRFEDYPARLAAFHAVPPDIHSAPEARAFPTALRRAARQGPDFAGSLKVAQIGCGADCILAGLVDLKTGRVVFLDTTVVTLLSVDTEFERLEFRRDSRLLVATGAPNEDVVGAGVTYYVWTGRNLRLLKHYAFQDLCRGHGGYSPN